MTNQRDAAEAVALQAAIIMNWRVGNAGEDDATDTARLVLAALASLPATTNTPGDMLNDCIAQMGNGPWLMAQDAEGLWSCTSHAPAAGEREPVAMTREEHHLEYLKQMAAYTGPIVSFDVREPYYLASCDACGWVGSSELCGTDSWGDDSDVYCPRCHASGADCGKVADRIPAPSDQEKLAKEDFEEGWGFALSAQQDYGPNRMTAAWERICLREAWEKSDAFTRARQNGV